MEDGDAEAGNDGTVGEELEWDERMASAEPLP